MKHANLCKFNPHTDTAPLKTVNFIFEGDADAQRHRIHLPNHTAYLISSGNGRLYFDTVPTVVSTGALVFGFEGEAFWADGEGLEYYYIGFTGQRSDELFRRFGVQPSQRWFGVQEGLLPFWRENIARATDDNIDIVSESVLMYTFSKLTATAAAANDVAALLVKQVEECFDDSRLSLHTLAAEWGYNEKYLSGCFKKRMGVGFSQYLKAVRLKQAVFLLDHGVEAVKNVAILCGFTDPLYFSKVFKENIGVSPTEYLKRKP